MNFSGKWLFDERKSTDRSALVYWLSEEVSSRMQDISGKGRRGSGSSIREIGAWGHAFKVQGTLGDCLYLEHLFQWTI